MPERLRELARNDPEYPRSFDALRRPPDPLYVAGRLPPGRAVAIVGARAATPYGRAQAGILARALAAHGVVVVSGLARGIDAAAHEGALDAGGITVAVLPGALDDVTPRAHAALAERIAGRGALVSERPSGGPLARGMFIERNRLIAALAGVVVVVEAAARSGALSTAAVARRLGRPVLAVPGDVDRPTSEGCHALIRNGARLCARPADVIGELPQDAGPEASVDARVFAALASVPRPLEEVARAAGVALDEALGALLRLEWAGAATARPGQRWVKRAGRP